MIMLYPNNQWPATLIHPAINNVAIEMQRVAHGKGEALDIETYTAMVQIAWLEEMAPAGNA